MRFFLSIDLNKNINKAYSFQNTVIAKHLKIEKKYNPDQNINLTTLFYERQKPGLIEKNWNSPFYNDGQYFIFTAGSVLYRNTYKNDQSVPDPKEILAILLEYGDDHYKVIKGNYYLVFLDKSEMKVSIYSSPMFMHPAFYSYIDNNLIVSNYIESFKEYIPLSIDEQGIVEFSLFDHSIYNRTIYKEIQNIPGGHLITFQNYQIECHIVYDIARWFTSRPKSREDSLILIKNTLNASLNDYINNTDLFNISLTGGFDGRLNFSFIDEADYPRLQAMSYGMRGSKQISVPETISKKLGFNYKPVFLDDNFESAYSELGHASIDLTCGVTGFNRAVYPYAYNIIKDYSRSCIIGQCDMIRPLYNNPAGAIFNDFSHAIFFDDFNSFKQNVLNFSCKAFIEKDWFTEKIIKNIYDEIEERYIKNYLYLNKKLQFYFFMLKESIMKYWHTEFHLVDIFVDDYVSFADLDYLELLFASEYAGIYKGLLANNQFERRKGQDLYVDLMSINNNKLNNFYLDRGFKPSWLKYGTSGWLGAAVAKKIKSSMTASKYNDTFNTERWSSLFYKQNQDHILSNSYYFNMYNIKKSIKEAQNDNGNSYRFNRAISLKLWLEKLGLI